jgi:hypothetical protein
MTGSEAIVNCLSPLCEVDSSDFYLPAKGLVYGYKGKNQGKSNRGKEIQSLTGHKTQE